MQANVQIRVWKGDELVHYHEGHNVWIESGSGYLTDLMGHSDFYPDAASITGVPFLTFGDLFGTFDLINSLITSSPPIDLEIAVDGGTPQLVTFTLLSSVQDIADQINAGTVGLTASLTSPTAPAFLVLTSDTVPGSSIEVTGGTAGGGLLGFVIGDKGSNPTEDRRVRYMGFGIGGVKQSAISVINSSPIVDSYGVGADPNATTGNEYNAEFPVNPPITTLERPVRITGGTAGQYPVGAPNIWLAQPPPFGFSTVRGGDVGVLSPAPPVIPVPVPPGPPAVLPTYTAGVDTGRIIFRSRIDTNAGELVYAPFTQIPLSEIGLFLNSADVNDPFNKPGPFEGHLVAYHSFATIVIVVGMVLEFSWTVSVI